MRRKNVQKQGTARFHLIVQVNLARFPFYPTINFKSTANIFFVYNLLDFVLQGVNPSLKILSKPVAVKHTVPTMLDNVFKSRGAYRCGPSARTGPKN